MVEEDEDLETMDKYSKFPWDLWMDGRIHVIGDPEDKDEVTRNRARLHQKAKSKGLRVVTRLTEDGLAFQFKKIEEGEL